MPRPSVRQIEYFVAVAQARSVRRAAEMLEVSQPTITAQIAQLEKRLGVTLFERRRSGTTLSPTGRQILPIARNILDQFDDLTFASGNATAGSAVYRLGVKSTFGPYALPHILPGLLDRYQDLHLYVREDSPGNLEAQLESGELDVILSSYPIHAAEFTGEPLIREPIELVMPADHPLAQQKAIEPSDLAGQKILITEPGHHFTRIVEETATRIGAEVSREYQGTSLDALRLMVATGMGLTFLPALYIKSEIRDETLAVRTMKGLPLSRILGLTWRATSPARNFYRRLAEDMRTVLREEFGENIEVVKNLR